MDRVVRRAVVVFLAGSLLLSGAEIASSVGYNVPTSLTIRAPRKVASNVPFHVTGRLKSSQRFCRKHSRVVLLRNGKRSKATVTSNNGSYSFTMKRRRTTRVQVRFDGKTEGVHPNQHVCGASSSKVLRVKVRRPAA